MKRGRDPSSGVSIEVSGHGRVGMHSASCSSARQPHTGPALHPPRHATPRHAIPDLAGGTSDLVNQVMERIGERDKEWAREAWDVMSVCRALGQVLHTQTTLLLYVSVPRAASLCTGALVPPSGYTDRTTDPVSP